jgi:hypothetical protein
MDASKLTIIFTGFFMAASVADAAVVLTYAESPGVENSTLSGTSVDTFNSLTGNTKYTNLAWTDNGTTIGTFDSIYIKSFDQYGGAGPSGSNYAVESASVGGSSAVTTSILTLTTQSAYFGLWWSAGDASNELVFKNNGVVIAEFTTQSLLNALPSTYRGNPRAPSSLDPAEPFAFINFFATGGQTFNQIEFIDTQSSGFEADNYTVRAAAYGTVAGDGNTLPGIGVESVTGTTATLFPANTTVSVSAPEPSSIMLLSMGLAALARRKIKG